MSKDKRSCPEERKLHSFMREFRNSSNENPKLLMPFFNSFQTLFIFILKTLSKTVYIMKGCYTSHQ